MKLGIVNNQFTIKSKNLFATSFERDSVANFSHHLPELVELLNKSDFSELKLMGLKF